MADLNPLIRVRKHAAEQKQKFLAELYRQAEELQRQKYNLETQLAEEQKKTQELGVQMLAYFGPYSEAVRGRVAEIDDAVEKLNVRIEIARESVREAFSELKKIEITQERRDDAEETAMEKRESNMLDEVALDIFRRQQGSD